jgi:hypothetical protein
MAAESELAQTPFQLELFSNPVVNKDANGVLASMTGKWHCLQIRGAVAEGAVAGGLNAHPPCTFYSKNDCLLALPFDAPTSLSGLLAYARGAKDVEMWESATLWEFMMQMHNDWQSDGSDAANLKAIRFALYKLVNERYGKTGEVCIVRTLTWIALHRAGSNFIYQPRTPSAETCAPPTLRVLYGTHRHAVCD